MKASSNNNKTSPKSGSIAVIGMGGIFPDAADVRQFWRNILAGKDCTRELPDYDFDGYYKKEDYYDPDPRARDKTHAKRAGYLPEVNFDPVEFGIPPKALESISQTQLMALLVAKQALRDGGFLEKGRNSSLCSRTGVVLGVAGFGDTAFQLASRLDYPNWRRVLINSGIQETKADEIVERLKSLYIEWDEDSFPGFLGNIVAGRISNRFNLGGLNCTVDAACASSLAALKMAVSELSEGNCDAVLTGGVQVENDVMSFLCFSKTPALSLEGVCRPYDANSDGMILGAGIGMIVLKRLEDAERDHDRIYAMIRGIGASSDGKSSSIYAPDKSGQLAALRDCYKKTGLSAGDIQLLEGHGTGTRAGDACEISTILEYFSDAAPHSIALGSVKSQIGHLRAAAGAAGMIKVILSLYHKVLPPTLHVRKPSPLLATGKAPFYLNTVSRDWNPPAENRPRRGAVSSFGFGGTNFHVLLEEYGGAVSADDWNLDIPLDRIERETPNKEKYPKVEINGFRYLNPDTRVRRDRALHERTGESSAVADNDDISKRITMDKGEKIVNLDISGTLHWEERVDRVQSQFHENQAGYIALFSRHMDRQYALIENMPPGPHLDKILDRFKTVMELLDKNQQRYHDNHDRYLENQLQLLNGRNLSPPLVAPQEMHLPETPVKTIKPVPSHRQTIPLRPSPQDEDFSVNRYSSPGEVSPGEMKFTPMPSLSAVIDSSVLSLSIAQVMDKLQEIVADQTGYPRDMLGMDMDLEADMGIDSIKRLEILAAMQEAFPEMPIEIDEIGELRTLGEIGTFLEDRLQGKAENRTPSEESIPKEAAIAATVAESLKTAGESVSIDVSPVIGRLRELITEQSGFLPEMLTEEIDLDSIGLDLVQWIEITATVEDEFPELKFDLQEMEHLNTLGEIERYLCSRPVAPTSGNDGASSAPASRAAPSLSDDIGGSTKKPDHPGEPSPLLPSSPFQVLISTADVAVETFSDLCGDTVISDEERKEEENNSRMIGSIVKKKLTDPDRILSIPARNDLWLIMDDGDGIGESLGKEIIRSGAAAVLLSFPENLIPYRPKQTESIDRVVLPGCDEEDCKAALAGIRGKYGPLSGFVYIHPFHPVSASSIGHLFREEESLAVRLAFRLAKHLRSVMEPKAPPARLSFIVVSRMDGALGTGSSSPFTIFGGCLSGLAQSLGREWPDVFCRFLDLGPQLPARDAASVILKELADPMAGLREVGYDGEGKRGTWEIMEEEADSDLPGFVPDRETVFLVSGGGRGITAECTVALAEKFHSRFILVGRTSPAEGEPEWAWNYRDEKSLREAILARMKGEKKRTTPVEVEKNLRPILAWREIRRTLQRIEENGGKAVYYSADITDGRELRKVIEKGRTEFGEIDVLIHGAGNISDRKIEDKTAKDFDQVFSCKVEGLQNLMECLDLNRLRSAFLFSSVASLWGNAGQTDYAMANSFLDKFARCCRLLLPKASVTAVHWGPWDCGMVTETLKKVYRERKIGLLSIKKGSRACLELMKNNTGPQLVVSENIPLTPAPIPHELRPVYVQRTLLPSANPFLKDHVIDSRPVMPATCAIHWMIQTCESMLDGHVFRQLRDFRVLKGIVFGKNAPKDYIVEVEPGEMKPWPTLAVKIRSRSGKQGVYSYSGEIVLAPHGKADSRPVYEAMDLTGNEKPPEEYYGGIPLFHGRSFQGVKKICNINPLGITILASLPQVEQSVQGQFGVSSWNPYVADVQLQSILLWSRDYLNAGCLPSAIGRIEQFSPIDFDEEFYVSTCIKSQASYRLVVDMIAHDGSGKIHARWTDVQLTVSKRLHQQFRKNRLEIE